MITRDILSYSPYCNVGEKIAALAWIVLHILHVITYFHWGQCNVLLHWFALLKSLLTNMFTKIVEIFHAINSEMLRLHFSFSQFIFYYNASADHNITKVSVAVCTWHVWVTTILPSFINKIYESKNGKWTTTYMCLMMTSTSTLWGEDCGLHWFLL